MISFESFREGLWGMTGRPDIPVGPYLASTLAAICRSGNYPEDIITVYSNSCSDGFSELPAPGYHRLAGWRLGAFQMPAPDGLSVRRVLNGQLEFDLDEERWGEEPLVLLSSTEPQALNRMMRECGAKPALTYAAGSAQVLVPPNLWRSEAPDGYYDTVGLSLVMLTSNESRGWNWANPQGTGEATGTKGLSGNNPDAVEPWVMEDSSYIWQLESCLDLVTLGTAASMLRFAGQEREGALMYQEFLISLRRYSADRADDLVEAQNALGF